MSSKSEGPSKASSQRRRRELRRNVPRSSGTLLRSLRRPDVVTRIVTCLAFVAAITALADWANQSTRPWVGQLVRAPIVNLIDFEQEAPQATERAREEARKSSPLIFAPQTPYLNRLQVSLEGLPRAVADQNSLDGVNPDLVKAFALTPELLPSLHRFVDADGTTDPQWTRWSQAFVQLLWQRDPLLSRPDFQAFATTLHKAVLLAPATDTTPAQLQKLDDALEVTDNIQVRSTVRDELEMLARSAGFAREFMPILAERVLSDPQPTVQLDAALTQANAQLAAESVTPVTHAHKRGEVIALPGNVLTREQVTQIDEARVAQAASGNAFTSRALKMLSIAGLGFGLCLLLMGYAVTFYERLASNALRPISLFAMMVCCLAIGTIVGVMLPTLAILGAVASTLVVVIFVALDYDRPLAILVAIAQSLLLALTLQTSAETAVALILTCATMASMLCEIRNRSALIHASTLTALVGAVSFAMPHAIDLAGNPNALKLLVVHAGSAIAASYLVGFLMLGALPSIERVFNLTTGLILSELRDPRHKLLRQLQERAPGTYNHSLQVANIAEAAADAIGADSLLVYVGALYHDIGKINKPDYFIENQAGGPNRHDKLSPAMSLLIITGHVKDGIELAREFGLPRELQHFIASHHGTTLVEYFFHAARTRAEETGSDDSVEEFSFRYPGPKPRTREAAILMLSDCIESATRTMGEPNASRIEALVRSMGRKRLADGQFDECPLTLRELRTVEDSIIKSLLAIYHGRIAYPGKNIDSANDDGANQTNEPQRVASA